MMTARTLYRIAGAVLLSAPLLARAQSTPAPVTALRFGAMADPSGRTTKNVTILVQADTVLRVGTGTAMIPKGATVVDLRRYTAIPGLIDVHTHMTFVRDKANPLVNSARSRDSVIAAAATNLRRTLETGVTTVRDLGASNYADIGIRDAVNSGAMIGPRMFVAGYGLSKVSTPPVEGQPSLATRGRVRDTIDIKAAIEAQLEAGADWIKMYGSTGTYANVTGVQTFTDVEMRVATETAHRLKRPIAIHSYGDSGGRAALRAGAESVGSAASCRWSDTPTSVSSRKAVSSETFGRLPCSNSLMRRGLTPALAASSAMDIRRLRRASRSADAMVNKGGDE
jgi:imidazolonepropionase-like amidohydrolase